METSREQELLQQKEFLLNGSPVAVLTGNEFEKKEGITLTQQVIAYYNAINNKAISPAYGEIILDRQAVEDDLAHGIGRNKAIAFAAVPNIIKKGIVILPLGEHKKGEKTLSAMVAAPLEIRNEEFIGVVVLRKYKSGNNKLYVHEVSLKNKLLENEAINQGVNKLSDSSSSPALKIPATNQGAIAKVLQNILSAKSPSQDSQKNLTATVRVRPAIHAVKRKGRGL
jgi:hypothetical protein